MEYLLIVGIILFVFLLLIAAHRQEMRRVTPKPHFHQGSDLQQLWSKVFHPLLSQTELPTPLPSPTAGVRSIRSWLLRHAKHLDLIEEIVIDPKEELELYSLPVELFLFQKLRHLDLHRTGIEILPELPEDQWPDLEVLCLSNNPLKTFPNSWAKLYHLKELTLSHTAIVELKPLFNIHLPRLKKLDLRFCPKLTYIDDSWLMRPKLTHFHIDTSPLKAFTIPENCHLEELTLQNVGMVTIPPTILAIQTLKKLDLRNNHIKTLPSFESSPIVTLHLDQNPLSTLPSSPHLETVTMTRCHVKALTEEPRMPKLRFFDASSNYIHAISQEWLQMPSLEVLFLAGNFIVYLPSIKQSNHRLQHLNLMNNRFASFPANLEKMTKLLSLNLSYNPNLTHLGTFSKEKFPHLEFLDLSSCPISEEA